MVRSLLRLGLSLAMVLAACNGAFAACAAPAQSGMVLCFPSVNSTVMYPATIELGLNSDGVPITHVSVYDGNTRIDDFSSMPGKLIDYAIKNGFHRITVNAWDANGKLYQAEQSFNVIGFGAAGSCSAGTGPITLCSPAANSFLPQDSLEVTVNFAANITSWSISIDGQPPYTSAVLGSTSGPLDFFTGVAAGNHVMTVSAVDSKGVTSTLTRKFSTFYETQCGPKTDYCSPGIAITQPSDISEESAGDEPTSFQLQAEVTGNTKPTTKMIVYLDGVKKEQSTGPGITADLTTTPGSHYVVILAWDTTGDMYETYGNVNVQ